MAFGFFSGNEDYADIIYTGGIIHTMDEAMPLADAVACKDGMIMRVGTDEDMQDIVGDETEVFDLEGMHMFPGFIEANASPVLDAVDEDVCFVIDESENIEEILENLTEYISDTFAGFESPDDELSDTELADYVNETATYASEADAAGLQQPEDLPENDDALSESLYEDIEELPEVIFGYGFDTALIKDLELEERQALLDEVCDEMPVLLLSEDGLTAWFNTIAFNIVASAAEENGMEILTLPFMLSVLSPVDPVKFEASASEVMHGYCREGFTSVFEGSASAYINSIFTDLQMALITEDNIKLRFIDGIYICSEANSAYIDTQLKEHKANYQELDGMILGGIVCAHVHGGNLSEAYLAEAMKTAASRGATFMIEAETPADTALCRQSIQTFREKAGGKMDIMLFHDEDSEKTETHFEYALIPENETAEDEIRTRTVLAAEKLGLSDSLGSVNEGKFADFTVFDEDPLTKKLINGELPDAEMTIIGGSIVYDSADDPDSMWSMISSAQIF